MWADTGNEGPALRSAVIVCCKSMVSLLKGPLSIPSKISREEITDLQAIYDESDIEFLKGCYKSDPSITYRISPEEELERHRVEETNNECIAFYSCYESSDDEPS